MTSTATLGVLLLVAPIATVAFASIFGSRSERVGASIYAVSIVVTWSAQLVGDKAPFFIFMGTDLLTAVALGVLTMRNPDKLWPGVAACAHTLVVVFSATRALEFPLSEHTYLVMLNVSSLAGLAALAVGTWAARWRPRTPSAWDIAAA